MSVCAAWALAFCQRHVAHFLAIPLLTTPAVALGVDDASAASAAARVFGHRYLGKAKQKGAISQTTIGWLRVNALQNTGGGRKFKRCDP